jgi:integrase
MSRTGEVRFGRWEEVDFDKRVWLIPAERMKMRNDHLIPLTDTH